MNIPSLFEMTTGKQTPQFSPSSKDETGESSPNTNATPSPTQSQQSTGEEFSTFLTLLTAQIRNQDPLAPLDSTQFVEQLATFSSLELQANGNAVLEDISQMLAQQIVLANNQNTTSES